MISKHAVEIEPVPFFIRESHPGLKWWTDCSCGWFHGARSRDHARELRKAHKENGYNEKKGSSGILIQFPLSNTVHDGGTVVT